MEATSAGESVTQHGRMQEGAVRTLVVDDQPSFRDAMRYLIAATPGFNLVGEAATGEDAIGAADELAPQLVLMDVRMPGMGGVEAARTLARRHPEIVVVLISVHGAEELPPEVVEGRDAAAFAHKKLLRPALLRELWEQHGGREN